MKLTPHSKTQGSLPFVKMKPTMTQQQLENLLTTSRKSIQQLEFMVKSLQIGINKRDELIHQLRTELLDLREKNSELMESAKHSKSTYHNAQSRSLFSRSGDHPKTRMDGSQKRLVRARTKENNIDDSLKTIMDMSLRSINQYLKRYHELNHVSQVKQLIQTEESFLQSVQNLDFVSSVSIYDAIHLILQEHKNLFKQVMKQQRLVECIMDIQENKSFMDQLREVDNLLCDSLDCDRVNLYVLDVEKDQLWSKNHNSDQITRISSSEDITGICFQTKETIIVNNAYNDLRFDKNYDIINNYRTDTLLLLPIIDPKSLMTIGVVQAFNKKQGFFNNEDVTFAEIVCQILASLIRAYQLEDEAVQMQNTFRSLFRMTTQLLTYKSAKQILREAAVQLAQLFHVSKAKVYLLQGDVAYAVNDKNQIVQNSCKIGVVGEAIISKTMILVQSLQSNGFYNNQIDLDTQMPIICMPVLYEGEVKMVLQVINRRSITSNKNKVFDNEILETFGSIVHRALQTQMRVEEIQNINSLED